MEIRKLSVGKELQGGWTSRDSGGRGVNKTPEKEWPGRRGKPGGASVPETDGGERFPEPCSGVSNAL